MLYEVDFSIKDNGEFQTVHKELVFAFSVSDCRSRAEEIKSTLSANQSQHIHIFIEE